MGAAGSRGGDACANMSGSCRCTAETNATPKEITVIQSLSRVRLSATPMDCSPPGSSVHGISQARVLEWAAVPFSRGVFPDCLVDKESTCNEGDPRSIPGLGRSAGEGIGYPLQFSWASWGLSW